MLVAEPLQCIPLRALWYDMVEGQCIDIGAFALGTGVISILTDWIALALPIRLVLQLHVSKAKKWQLVGVFMLGGLYVCVS